MSGGWWSGEEGTTPVTLSKVDMLIKDRFFPIMGTILNLTIGKLYSASYHKAYHHYYYTQKTALYGERAPNQDPPLLMIAINVVFAHRAELGITVEGRGWGG